MALGVMAALWPLRLRSLHADFCAGARVMSVSWHIINRTLSGLKRDSPILAIAPKVLTRRPLHQRTPYNANTHALETLNDNIMICKDVNITSDINRFFSNISRRHVW